MDITAFLLSVLASLVAAIILGGATYKLIYKNKSKNTIKQKGKGHTAYMDSTVHINNEKEERD